MIALIELEVGPIQQTVIILMVAETLSKLILIVVIRRSLLKCCFPSSTWSGPAWSPAQSLSSILISIQSLLNERPYHNEPGFEQVD